MSDDDRDIDIESDVSDVNDASDDGDDSDSTLGHSNNTQYGSQAEKRAHHNALERKRRNHIKDKFIRLRDSVPSLTANKVASRAQILRKSIEHIYFMKRKVMFQRQYNESVKRECNVLESKAQGLEKLITDKIALMKREGKPIPDLSNIEVSSIDSSDSESEMESYNFSYDETYN